MTDTEKEYGDQLALFLHHGFLIIAMFLVVMVSDIIASGLIFRKIRKWVYADVLFLSLFANSFLIAAVYVWYIVMIKRKYSWNHKVSYDQIYAVFYVMEGLHHLFPMQIIIIGLGRVAAVRWPISIHNHASKNRAVVLVLFLWVAAITGTTLIAILLRENRVVRSFLYDAFTYTVLVEAGLVCFIYGFIMYRLKFTNMSSTPQTHSNKLNLIFCVSISVAFLASYVPQSIDMLWNDRKWFVVTETVLPIVCFCVDAVLYVVKDLYEYRRYSRKNKVTPPRPRFSTIIQNINNITS